MIKRSLFALALAAALPLSAHAEDGISFTNAELDYVSHDAEDISPDGWNLQGQAGFAQHWYAYGQYSTTSENDVDIGVPVDVDYNTSGLGVGFHTAISDKAQFLAEVGYRREELEFDGGTLGGFNTDGNGYRVAAGIRGQLAPRFEGEIKVNYTDVDEMGDGVGGEIGALFSINDTWGITARYEHDSRDDLDINTWKVGVRASF